MKFKKILLFVVALIVLAKIFQGKSTNQKLAWEYGSEAKTITNHDTLVLLRWGKIGQEWNLASAPIIRDLLDQSVSTDDFLKTSTKQLLELRSVLYKMGGITSENSLCREGEGVKYKVEITTPILKRCTVELEAASEEQIREGVDSVLEANNWQEGELPWDYEEDGLTVEDVNEV